MERPDPSEVRALLVEHGIQVTPQRVQVATCVLWSENHPTAEDVVRAVQADDASVSQATVYNTLHRLVQAGLLSTVQPPGERARYDARVTPHHHLIDAETGELTDLEPGAVDVRVLQLPEGVACEHVDVFVVGRRVRRSPAEFGPQEP